MHDAELDLGLRNTDSIASAGTPRMPLGKAVADSPSLPGRAPMPPAEKKM